MNPPSTITNAYYQLKPLAKLFGAQVVSGVNLATADLSDTLFIKQIKEDLVKYRFLLFRNQRLTGGRQVAISNALGTVESTFYKHPKSPHPDIFRVSNDENEGCTQVGRSGWHLDGTFQIQPFQYQTMYFEQVAAGGDTFFMPLREFYESLPEKTRVQYDHLWMVTGRRQAPIHPLVYQHPFRHESTMLFHCGRPFVDGWFTEESNGNIDTTYKIPASNIQEQLTSALESKFEELGFCMKWQVGDFLISDNLGLAHYASDGTQADRNEVGLRILHRTTIVGGPETVPRKADGRTSFVL
jgi:alpha-ketoglutarate-dependent taurine dioxygenase